MSGNEVRFRLAVEGGQQVTGALSGVEQRLDRLNSSIARTAHYGAGLLVLAPSLQSLATGMMTAADTATTMANQLRLATGSAALAAQAYDDLFDVAQRSRVGFSELAGTYASISRAGQTLGLSQSRLMRVTEAIGNAMAISGGSAASMQAALVQLSQGLASGTLRGDELNSVMEQSPRLAQALAEGMGVTTGELRKMGEAGEITAQRVINALEKSAPKLAEEVKGATLTIGQAFTLLSNSTLKFVGEADKATGASGAFSSAVRGIADAVSGAAGVIERNETAFKLIGGATAGAAGAAGILAVASALRAVAGSVGAVGLALSANPVVLTLLGIGAVAGAGIAVVRAQAKTADGIRDAIETLEQANARSEAALGRAAGRDAAQAGIRKTMDERTAQVKALRGELALLQGQGADTRAEDQRLASAGAAAAAATKQQADAAAYLGELRGKLSGVDKDYTANLSRLQDLRAQGLVSEKEYISLLSDLAEKNYKATDADKARSKAGADAASQRKRAAEEAARAVATYRGEVADLANGKAGLSSDYNDKLAALYKGWKLSGDGVTVYRAAVEALIAKQPFMVGQIKAEADERERVAKLMVQQAVDEDKAIEALRGSIKDQADRNEVIGLEGMALAQVEHARAMANIKLMEERMYMDEASGATPARLAFLAEEIRLQRELADARLAGSVKSGVVAGAKSAEAETQRFWDQMGQSLSDALMNGGKSAGDYIKGLFRNMVLRPAIQASLSSVAGALGFGLPGSAVASSGGALSSLSSLGSLGKLGGLSGLGSAFSGGAGLALSGAGGTGLALEGAGAMIGSGSVGAGLSQGAGALAPWAMGGMAGLALGKGISGGYGGNAAVNVGTIAGALLGGPLGAAIGGALGGVANRAFGRKAAEATSITGTLGTSNDSLQTNMVAKGGWFRSDKRWAEQLGAEQTAVMSSSFGALRTQAADFAKALGGPVDTIKSYTTAIDIAVTGDASKDAAAVTKFFEDQQAKLVEMAAGGSVAAYMRQGENVAQTAQRLAGSLTAVNEMLTATGKTALSLSAASGALASDFADLFGGVAGMQGALSAYVDAIYSDSERLALGQAGLSRAFADLGRTVPATTADYKALVEAQDLNSQAGREMYAKLLQLAPAFAEVTGAANEAAASLIEKAATERADLEEQLAEAIGGASAAREFEVAKLDASNQALQRRIWALQDEKAAAEALTSAGQGVVDFVNELRGTAGGAQTLGQLRSTYASNLAAAQAGDTAASGRVTEAARALVEQLKATATDPVDLARQTSRIASELSALPASIAYTTQQVTSAAVVQAASASAAQVQAGSTAAEAATTQTFVDLLSKMQQLVDEQRAGNATAVVIASGVSRTATILTNVTPDGDAVAMKASA